MEAMEVDTAARHHGASAAGKRNKPHHACQLHHKHGDLHGLWRGRKACAPRWLP